MLLYIVNFLRGVGYLSFIAAGFVCVCIAAIAIGIGMFFMIIWLLIKATIDFTYGLARSVVG